MAKKPFLGGSFHKIHPMLRMIANGSLNVNTLRSSEHPSIRVKEEPKIVPRPIRVAAPTKKVRRKKLKAPTEGIETSVFVARTSAKHKEGVGAADKVLGCSRGDLATASVNLSELEALANDPTVAYVEPGERVVLPTPQVSEEGVRVPRAADRNFGRGGGSGRVLIGVIDVQGFDFSHADFLNSDGTTRFERIWDQGGSVHAAPQCYGYGSEIMKPDMDQALETAKEGGLPAVELEPQSQMADGSHGTHVASIAAGNRGVCHNALLAGVLVTLPKEDYERRQSFYDSTRIAHAVEYLLDMAEELREGYGLDDLPVSINISLGTNGHAHDGSSGVSRWIDHALATPGRSICVAAGNAGQEKPDSPGGLGHIMGRIHTSGRIPASGLVDDIFWIVAGDQVRDVSENECEIWYSPADRFSVSVRTPNGEWVGPIAPGEFIENRQLNDGAMVSIYNELYHPANGANYIGVYLTPYYSPTEVIGVSAGEWVIRLHGVEVRDGGYDGWIERDDPQRLLGDFWAFPSFFSVKSNVDDSSVSSLACGQRVVSVANLDAAQEKINISSSQGPTRDERKKPDVAAPGTDIVAANGFAQDGDSTWIKMTGTSMASPFVAGVIGLMLAENPGLTSAQIVGILQRTSQPLPGDAYQWKNDAGYGVIQPEACIAEARAQKTTRDRT
ncbi:MAG: S8 family serine peptidase [Candidatus Thiodiazotropha taylori]